MNKTRFGAELFDADRADLIEQIIVYCTANGKNSLNSSFLIVKYLAKETFYDEWGYDLPYGYDDSDWEYAHSKAKQQIENKLNER